MPISRALFHRIKLLGAYVQRNAQVDCWPSVITVETTTRCNLSCPNCYRRHDTQVASEMPLELFAELISGCRGQVELINLFGMGEPLLDPWLIERVRLCRAAGIKTHISTNATLLERSRSQELIAAGLSAITFSIDSLHPEVYERRRPGARYAETLRNVLGFIELARQARPRPSTFVRMVVDRRNAGEVRAVRRFWRERGADEVRGWGDEFGTQHEPRYAEPDRHRAAGPCPFLWQGPALVRCDGGLYPCCAAGLQGGPPARLSEVGLAEFWSGEIMREVRHKHLRGVAQTGLDCQGCRSIKPLPALACLSFLTDGLAARRWGMRLERWSAPLNLEVTFDAIG